MAYRSAASGVMTFGLAKMPVKLFVSSSKESISFKKITPDGNTVKQRTFDSKIGNEIDMSCCDFGYEVEKDKFVIFTKEEYDALDSNGTNLAIEQFVPEETVDSVYVNESYYIKPDLGGEAVFQALAANLKKNSLCAIGRWHGKKDTLIQIRPYKNGLMLHTLYYSNEVRDYDNTTPRKAASEEDVAMVNRLVDDMKRVRFDPKKYENLYTKKVLEAVDNKRAESYVDDKPDLVKSFEEWLR
jgi:DNA end-binding protein Ku